MPRDYFDVVLGYPRGGEEPVMRDLMGRHGGSGALLLPRRAEGVEDYRAVEAERFDDAPTPELAERAGRPRAR